MKTIGLLGGMSWESTALYYKIINETIKEKLGGLNSEKILLYSVNFAEIELAQATGNWEQSAQILSSAAIKLQRAGADFIFICTNTMHKVLPQIQTFVDIPIIHIAEVTADELKRRDIFKVALLGTKYTMTEDFYKEKLIKARIEVLVPNGVDMQLINDVIYDELCLGLVSQTSKHSCIDIISKLQKLGARGVILGCTEIGLLIKQQDISLPIFDTAHIHAKKAAMLAIG